jgi:hypothetical protein
MHIRRHIERCLVRIVQVVQQEKHTIKIIKEVTENSRIAQIQDLRGFENLGGL